jgi:hypothetical protein
MRRMKATTNVTKAGGRLFGISLAVATLVGCATWDWATTPLDKDVVRVSPPLYYSSLFVVWGVAYLVGWLILRARGIAVAQASIERT